MSTIYGTNNQDRYVEILRTRLGAESVVAATRKVLGLDALAPLPDSVSSEMTSVIIDELKLQLPPKAEAAPGRRAGPAPGGAQRMTGRELLDLANPDRPIPHDTDADLRAVIARLRRLRLVQGIVDTGEVDSPLALNGREPILTAQLVELLGGAGEAAKALGVTIKTLEGWGEYLPESHESRAELVTRGALKARLPV